MPWALRHRRWTPGDRGRAGVPRVLRRRVRRLRGLGYLLTSDWAEAEEPAQDALVRTYRVWPRVRRHERPGAYARKVLLNRHRSLLRRAKVEARHLAGRRVEDTYEAELGSPAMEEIRGKRP